MDGFSSVYEHSAGNEQILMILCRLCRAAKCGLWTSCSHEDQQWNTIWCCYYYY